MNFQFYNSICEVVHNSKSFVVLLAMKQKILNSFFFHGKRHCDSRFAWLYIYLLLVYFFTTGGYHGFLAHYSFNRCNMK